MVCRNVIDKAYWIRMFQNGDRRVLIAKFQMVLRLLAVVTPLLAQDQPAPFTFRVRTQLVVQTVSVTDKDGRPIESLTKDDFILTEDGAPQTISVFEFEKLDDTSPPRPVRRSPRRRIEAGCSRRRPTSPPTSCRSRCSRTRAPGWRGRAAGGRGTPPHCGRHQSRAGRRD